MMDPDLYDLLTAWFGTEIAPSRGDELIARLRDDEAFRREFVAEVRMMGMLKAVQSPESRWLRLEDELGWSAGATLGDRALEDRVVSLINGSATPRRSPQARRGWVQGLAWAASAAAVAAGIVLANWGAPLWWEGPRRTLAIQPMVTAPRSYPKIDTLNGLAMAVKLNGVQWSVPGEPHPSEGDILPAGWFRIASGRARLSMLTGVVLDIEGPAEVELVSSDKVICHRGRIRARVPDGAEGFVVGGPSSAVVDLGTEFGVNVGSDGTMRGQIFKGQLEAALLNASGTSQRSYFLDAARVGATRAFEVHPQERRIEAVAESGDFAAASAPSDPPLLLTDRYRGAVLRSHPWSYWRLESLVDGVTPNEVAGKPALRATGPIRLAGAADQNHCAEFPSGAPGQYLAMDESWRPTWDTGFAVELWALTEEITHASLAGMNSPVGTNNHVFLLETTSRNRLTIHKPASIRLLHRFPPGWEGGDNTYSQDPYIPYRWHHIVGQVKDGAIELFVDGMLASRLAVTSDHTDVPCQFLLGRLTTLEGAGVSVDRPFVGRMDEVALYDRPLTAAEVREHHDLGTVAEATPSPQGSVEPSPAR